MGLDAVQEAYWRGQADLDKRIEAMEAKLEALRGRRVDWFTGTVHPIRHAIAKRFPAWQVEAHGPFGIACNVTIEATADGRVMGRLDLRLVHEERGHRLHVVDFSTDTGQFSPGSIGAMNGLNHPTHAVPRDLDGLVALFVQAAT